MATFYIPNTPTSQVGSPEDNLRKELERKVGALTSSSSKRDIPSNLVGDFFQGKVSYEDLETAIKGSPTFNPNIGPQIDYGQGKQPLSTTQQQALASGQDINTVANIGFGGTPSTVTANDIKNGAPSQYTVAPGDTISAIASRYGVPVSAISGYKSGDINKIGVGEVLTIAGKGTNNISASPASANVIAPTTQIGVTGVGLTPASKSGSFADVMTKTLDDYIREAQAGQKSAESIQQDALTARLAELAGQTAGQTQALADEEAKAGVANLTQQLKSINDQIKATRAEQNALNVDLEGKPITMASIIGAKAQANAVLDAKVFTLAAQAQALQGDITLAKETAQKAVDLRYAPILEEYKIKQAQLDLLKPSLDRQEKIRAEALAQKNADEAKELASKIANEKDLNATLLNQMQTYPDAGILLTDSLYTANQKITTNSKIYKDKVKSVGTGGVGNAGVGSADIFSAIASSAGGKATTDSFRNSFEKGYNVLYQLKDLDTSLVDENTGPIMGIIRSANPYDTKAQQIKAQLTAIVPNLARGIYGEVGVLTDNDIALYSKTIPNIKSTNELRTSLLAITTKSVARALENKLRVQAAGGVDVSGYASMLQDAHRVADSLLASSGLDNVSNAEQKIIDFGTKNPAYQATILKTKQDNPNWSADDVLQFLKATLPTPLLIQL